MFAGICAVSTVRRWALLRRPSNYEGSTAPISGATSMQRMRSSIGSQQSPVLPTQRAYYHYEGSLTTPPCSETVAWIVLTHPIEVDEDDIARFAKLNPLNSRPVQKRDRRFILSSRPLKTPAPAQRAAQTTSKPTSSASPSLRQDGKAACTGSGHRTGVITSTLIADPVRLRDVAENDYFGLTDVA